jgi:hypothetical protein
MGNLTSDATTTYTFDTFNRRFLTPRPLGPHPGPNLYAYCSNNPLSLLDTYGLYEFHLHHILEPRAQTKLAQTLNLMGIPAPVIYQPISSMSVEQVHVNRLETGAPYAVHLPNPFPHRKPLPRGQIIYINPSSGFIPLNFSIFRFIYDIFLVTCRPAATGFLGICRI